jgi:ABC-type phosphonate transport system ATPase subunit
MEEKMKTTESLNLTPAESLMILGGEGSGGMEMMKVTLLDLLSKKVLMTRHPILYILSVSDLPTFITVVYIVATSDSHTRTWLPFSLATN